MTVRRLRESVRRKQPEKRGMATGSCMTQTRHRSVAAAAILTRSRTV